MQPAGFPPPSPAPSVPSPRFPGTVHRARGAFMSQVLARPSARPLHFRLRRRPLPYWLLATAVALATAALVGHLVGDAARERAQWGELRPTVVVRHRVPAGQHLTP